MMIKGVKLCHRTSQKYYDEITVNERLTNTKLSNTHVKLSLGRISLVLSISMSDEEFSWSSVSLSMTMVSILSISVHLADYYNWK